MKKFDILFNQKTKKQFDEEQEIAFCEFRDLFYNFKKEQYRDEIIYSVTFNALFNKIERLIFNIGSPSSVLEMMSSIASDRKKNFSGKDSNTGNGNNGHWNKTDDAFVFDKLPVSHFRENFTLHTLNAIELKYLNEFLSFYNRHL